MDTSLIAYLGGFSRFKQDYQLDKRYNRWLDIGLSTEPADFNTSITAALECYKLTGRGSPEVILQVASPYAATVEGTAAVINSRMGSSLKSVLRIPQIISRSNLSDHVYSKLSGYPEHIIEERFSSKIDLKSLNKVSNQFDNNFRPIIRRITDYTENDTSSYFEECSKLSWENHFGGTVFCKRGFKLELYKEIFGSKFDELNYFHLLNDLIVNCGWIWWHEKVLAISDKPEKMYFDTENRPHNEKGPSVVYRDGWSLYHWHGIPIPSKWIMNNPPSPIEALHWPNIEQRRAACEIVGWSNIVKELKPKIIDKNENPQLGTLLRVNLPGSSGEQFLCVTCGTGRDFILPVPKNVNTAQEAQNWMWNMPKGIDYSPEVRT